MKNVKKIMALLLMATMLFTLVACGSSGSGKASPVGTYSLSGMSDESGETSQEDMDLLVALGMTITLELREDNTGTLSMFGESMDLTWDDNNIIVEGESTPYTFDGTVLSMEEDGTKMEFTKDEDK